ncbi:MAG: MBOAT family protein [Eubacteriales bacterium]|nr:MBOAT family protein [Eubacteriales bacterium]MDD3881596.1 MBOAT family protein [Eubacteriales bacterium]MDD4512345.1 MBOAT family protein [Eubacteriales bacterium]
MLFSSLTFLLYFLPIVIILHYILPNRFQNAFLLLSSIVFYAWGEIAYVPLIAAILALDYLLSRLISSSKGNKARMYLIIGCMVNFGALFYYKYIGFLFELLGLSEIAPDVALPLGISFFTFQAAAYLVDIYRRDIAAEKNPITFSAFILMFPQLIAGPIIRYADVSEELGRRRRPPAEMLEKGILTFLGGLALKVLIANPLGELWVNAGAAAGMGSAWLAMIGYSMQIYFDFFGYSLMAVGIGKMLGLTFAQNFSDPYSSRSVTEFWRRWHITLGKWFREYVYIPMGGNRRGKARTALNLFAVWALTGLWHGASLNFLLWGLYMLLLILLEKHFIKGFLEKHRTISHIYTLFAVFIGWMLFTSDDLSRFPAIMSSLFSFTESGEMLFWLRQYAFVLLLAVLLCIPKVTGAVKAAMKRTWVRLPAMAVLIILSLSALINSGYNPFLYFRF